jgi:hypothetical protein
MKYYEDIPTANQQQLPAEKTDDEGFGDDVAEIC